MVSSLAVVTLMLALPLSGFQYGRSSSLPALRLLSGNGPHHLNSGCAAHKPVLSELKTKSSMQHTMQPKNISVYSGGNPPCSSDCALLAKPILLPAPVGSAELLAWSQLLSFRP